VGRAPRIGEGRPPLRRVCHLFALICNTKCLDCVKPDQPSICRVVQFAHVCHAQIARRVILPQAVALVPSGKSDR
jgi:hypothetical protein